MAGLFPVAGGLGALGSVLGGITGMLGAGERASALDHAALQSSEEAGVNSELALRQGNAAAATGAVRAAANGGGFAGSSLGVISNLSSEAMANARTQIWKGNVTRQNDLYQAAIQRAQGLSSLVGGLVGGASSLVGGFMQQAFFNKAGSAQSAAGGDNSNS